MTNDRSNMENDEWNAIELRGQILAVISRYFRIIPKNACPTQTLK
jgi:septum formation topological specificity factor MinE